jgi:lipopolysaccharide export system permease protein
MHFKESDKVFDMSAFTKVQKTDENTMKGGQTMMNLSQLNENIDSVHKTKPREATRFSEQLNNYLTFRTTDGKLLLAKMPTIKTTRQYHGTFLNNIPDSLHRQVIDVAESQARSAKLFTDVTSKTFEVYDDQLTNLLVEWHRKFSLSFACLLLYLIGAPLGAIIRKGGIGLPLIIAVIFFMAYFITS